MYNFLLRRSFANVSADVSPDFARLLKGTFRTALIPITAVVLAACGSFTPNETSVLKSPVTDETTAPLGDPTVFGLTSFAFGMPTTTTGASVRLGGVSLTLRTSGSTKNAEQTTFSTTYLVRNISNAAVQNLTLLAVHQGADIAGTAITTMSAGSGESLTDPAAARGLLPTFQTPASAGLTDAQAYTPEESQTLTTTAQNAGLLKTDDEVLGYGFVVQQSDGRRILAPGEQGEVTLSYIIPNDAADTLPTKFTSSFLPVQDAVTRVTQLEGETQKETLLKAGRPVNAQQMMTLSVSSPSSAPNMKVVPVKLLRTFTVPRGPLYGVIQSQDGRRSSDYQAGLRVRSLELAWDRVEPASGVWNTAYLNSKRAEYMADVRSGFEVVLELGVQYPPAWLAQLPDSHFVDQHGTAYTSTDPGANPVNAVFSDAVRTLQARYVKQVFRSLGSNFYAVRLGWGRYGELGFPLVDRAANSYWAFDDLAQGRRPGLPAGVQVDPVAGWTPPASTRNSLAADQLKARRFVDWYLDSLKNYHDWQIQVVRSVFPGRLFMLYPSFGLRPGQVDQAVAGGLSGQTSPEINTELQRGFDFARFISGIRDPLVSPYTTWLDVDGFFVDDAGSNTAGWSPAHYFSVLASANPLQLQVWGENTGRNSKADLNRCMNRVKTYRLGGMFWAFNEDLYDSVHASIADYRSMIASQ